MSDTPITDADDDYKGDDFDRYYKMLKLAERLEIELKTANDALEKISLMVYGIYQITGDADIQNKLDVIQEIIRRNKI